MKRQLKRVSKDIYNVDAEIQERFQRFKMYQTVKVRYTDTDTKETKLVDGTIIGIVNDSYHHRGTRDTMQFVVTYYDPDSTFKRDPVRYVSLQHLELANGIINHAILPDGVMLNSKKVQKMLLARGYRQNANSNPLEYQKMIYKKKSHAIVYMEKGLLTYSPYAEHYLTDDHCGRPQRSIEELALIPTRNELVIQNRTEASPEMNKLMKIISLIFN